MHIGGIDSIVVVRARGQGLGLCEMKHGWERSHIPET